MADFFDQLEDKHIDFIKQQQMFFVATAPKEGRINLSPKGLDTFRVLSKTQVAYLDFMGSGNETAAHLLDDGRITVMFNSFNRNPLIMRLYGRGTNYRPDTDQFKELFPLFDHELHGVRQIFVIDIESIQTSCGYGVALFGEFNERPTLQKWADSKDSAQIDQYYQDKNTQSIDGLPVK